MLMLLRKSLRGFISTKTSIKQIKCIDDIYPYPKKTLTERNKRDRLSYLVNVEIINILKNNLVTKSEMYWNFNLSLNTILRIENDFKEEQTNILILKETLRS